MPINIKAMANNVLVRLQAVKEVRAGTVLHNRNGTSDASPRCPNCGSWVRHWEVMTETPRPETGNCAVVGCNGKDENGDKYPIEGCHVNIKDGNDVRVFIVPLCKGCNGKHGKDVILGRSMKLVWANFEETCSKLMDESKM